ncbi:MAG TPA: aldolase/citrate lyase family protein [Xanthobacteraceae bacterium]|nr:aldolase/citrate lyase family protein [Xanthobacteraceae bacterium]
MTIGNAVKAAAASGQTVRGIHLTFAAPTIIEILSPARLDFVYLDGEHGTFDWRDIEIGCITAERHGMTPIARVPDRAAATITRFLDRGVLGIVAPHVESVDDAKEAIEATYFAPLGQRSFGGGRPFFLAIDDKPAHIAQRNATVSLCLMIESQAGLDAAHQLAALDGVDYLSFGMMDLAQSLGHPGNPAHPDVKRAVQDASARVRKAGKRVREDFMNFAWVSEILVTGAKQLLGD